MAQRTARIQAFTVCGTQFWPVAIVWFLMLSALAEASELRNSPIVKAVEQARPSTVNIRGEKTLPRWPVPAAANATEGGRRVNGMGTGVVIDSRGYIVTNYHVVDGVKEIQVTLTSEENTSPSSSPGIWKPIWQ